MGSKPRILVIDDEPTILELLTALLEDNYDVTTTPSVLEALELVAPRYPDLLLIDLMLPIMDGETLLAKLRNDGIRIPILIYSATIGPANVREADHWVKMLGGQGVLGKPFDIDELDAAIQATLKQATHD